MYKSVPLTPRLARRGMLLQSLKSAHVARTLATLSAGPSLTTTTIPVMQSHYGCQPARGCASEPGAASTELPEARKLTTFEGWSAEVPEGSGLGLWLMNQYRCPQDWDVLVDTACRAAPAMFGTHQEASVTVFWASILSQANGSDAVGEFLGGLFRTGMHFIQEKEPDTALDIWIGTARIAACAAGSGTMQLANGASRQDVIELMTEPTLGAIERLWEEGGLPAEDLEKLRAAIQTPPSMSVAQWNNPALPQAESACLDELFGVGPAPGWAYSSAGERVLQMVRDSTTRTQPGEAAYTALSLGADIVLECAFARLFSVGDVAAVAQILDAASCWYSWKEEVPLLELLNEEQPGWPEEVAENPALRPRWTAASKSIRFLAEAATWHPLIVEAAEAFTQMLANQAAAAAAEDSNAEAFQVDGLPPKGMAAEVWRTLQTCALIRPLLLNRRVAGIRWALEAMKQDIPEPTRLEYVQAVLKIPELTRTALLVQGMDELVAEAEAALGGSTSLSRSEARALRSAAASGKWPGAPQPAHGTAGNTSGRTRTTRAGRAARSGRRGAGVLQQPADWKPPGARE